MDGLFDFLCKDRDGKSKLKQLLLQKSYEQEDDNDHQQYVDKVSAPPPASSATNRPNQP